MQRVLTSQFRSQMRRVVSRGISSDYWKQSKVLKELEDNFTILHGDPERFSKIRCEVLIKPTEDNNQNKTCPLTETKIKVNVLTFPSQSVFNDANQFLDIMGFIQNSVVMFNYDPSMTLSLDRKVAFLSRQPIDAVPNESYSLKMKYDISEAGFYRNIFGLDFSDEALFELKLMKKAFEIGWDNRMKREEREGGLNEKREEIMKAFLMDKDISYSNQNINLLFQFLMLNADETKYNKKNIGMVGMPELLFRAQMARHLTPASIVDNLIDYYDFTENRIKFLENQSKRHMNSEREYVFNDYMRQEDYLVKTSLHYNSLFFRSCYSFKLIEELSKTHKNLVVVVDPLVNRHFAEIIQSKKNREETQRKDIESSTFQSSLMDFESKFGDVTKVHDQAVSKYFEDKLEAKCRQNEEKSFAVDPISSDFEDMNTIHPFNLKRKDFAHDLAFKMAALDVLWDSKLYHSKLCEFDLYYLGRNLFDIPKDLRKHCQKRFIISYKQIEAMREKIRESIKKCRKVGDFDELKKDIEEKTGMTFDGSEMFKEYDDPELDIDPALDYENDFSKSELDEATRDEPDQF